MLQSDATRSQAPAVVAITGARPRVGDTFVDEPERYAVEGQIGEGGMGTVLAAKGARLGRPVALKVVTAEREDLLRRFEREAQVTAKLQHPSIVPVYGSGRRDGRPFYAMKHVTGEPLDKVIANASSLTERVALVPKVIAVTEAIAYAHSENVIHRDLKPANILVGAFGETVVIDWGLAKDLGAVEGAVSPYRNGDDATVCGHVMGTPAYMPREQARGEELDERADVYALGAILYHVLAGRAPYKRAGEDSVPWESMLARVIAGTPEPLGDDVPLELRAIVTRAMARDAADRYATAGELAEDLRRFQTGQLVGAHRYSMWQLVKRWLRRYRTAVTVAAILIGLLAIVSVLSVQRIRDERSDAEDARAVAEDERGKAVTSKREAEDLMGFMLGDLKDKLVPVGKLDILDAVAKKAMTYYDKQDSGATDDEKRKRALAYFNVGEVLLFRGNVDGALDAYRASLAIRETLTTPTDLADAASSHVKVGYVLKTKSKVKDALAEYRAGLALADKAASIDPNNPVVLAECAEGHEGVGDVIGEQGDEPGALAEYRMSEPIRARLVEQAPANTRYLRLLSFVQLRLGDALMHTGDLESALTEHREALATLERALKIEPDNTQVQSDLAGAHERMSRALLRVNRFADAATEIDADLDIAQRLARRDPSNTEWARSLATAYFNLGEVRKVTPGRKGALAAYQQALAVEASLSARDPANQQWRRDLMLDHQHIGHELAVSGDFAAAKAEAVAAGDQIDELLALEPDNLRYQVDRASNHQDIGVLLNEMDTLPAAIAATAELAGAVSMFQAVVDRDPQNLDSLRMLAGATQQLGDSYVMARNPLAVETYRKCEAILEKLIAAQPDQHGDLLDRLRIHYNIASLDEELKLGDARAEYAIAADIADKLVALEPNNAQFGAVRKQAHDELAKCCKK